MLLHKPIATVIIVIAILIFGGLALSRLSIELLPDVTQPTILVSTEYVGAPATEVEVRINEQMEGVLGSVRGVEEIRGIARQGQSLIFLTFDWGSDMDLAFLNVREKLDQARYLLPDLAERPQLIYSSASDEPIATLALTLKDVESQSFENRLEIKRWAEQVFTRRLEQQSGIAQAILVGAVEPEVQINFDPGLLDRFGISLAEVKQVVSSANVFSSTGELRDGWYRYAIKIESRIESLNDIKNIPVKSLASGRVLFLHEIADVALAEADPTSFSLLDGKDILTVQVKKEYGSNSVTVFQTLVQVLDEIKEQNPDIHIEVIKEDSTYIQNSISNLLQTLIIGGILAFLVLFFFLEDVKSPFTIGISIPVSIFFTFTAMYLFGIQLNIISLSGLTLGIGLLLDNSIVVLENINRYRKQGFDRFESARKGTNEIALAVTASTFTTISVFLPLIFLGGFEGAFFRDLAATLSISLMSSLLVALVILPVFVAHLSGNSIGFLNPISTLLDSVVNRYERSLQKVIQRPFVASLLALTLILLAGWMFIYIPKSALPESEPVRVEQLITLPGNTSLKSARATAQEMVEYIRQYSGLDYTLAIGGYSDNISLNAIKNEGLNKFTISVPVETSEEEATVKQLFNDLDRTFETWSFEDRNNSGANSVAASNSAPVELSIVGTDRSLSRRVGNSLEELLQTQFDGFVLTEKYPQRVQVYELRFKEEELLKFEITESELVTYLESITRGSWITDWNRQDEQISIRLLGNEDRILNPSDIKVNIKNRIIPLADLAEIRISDEAEQMERADQSPILTFASNLTFTDWWWGATLIKDNVSTFIQNTGFEVRIDGTAPQLIQLLEELGLLLLISVLLIYLILAIQYENLLYPLLIILAIPFAWIGSIAILYVTGVSLNALSFMGILILTGIAVNDSILKVDFMRRYFDETGDLDEAIKQAGIHRFRPVVMTSLTTILGLIPMLFPIGDGYVFRQSLAIALMGGMITSTLLTLYIIPMVFRLINRKKFKSIKE
ncbi:MAG: efflux RND transporter permease subunit [Balneola sp.]|nr:efflux RND transporter permease subunit [Balneola sp.]